MNESVGFKTSGGLYNFDIHQFPSHTVLFMIYIVCILRDESLFNLATTLSRLYS